jgi:type II secretory ATPase GspE/PulE/Tfp pilus assembly ATPase PilB-like protein
MAHIKAIEARLHVADVLLSAGFYGIMLGFKVGTLWPENAPEFAILHRDLLRLQLRKHRGTPASSNDSASTLWLDVAGLVSLYDQIREKVLHRASAGEIARVAEQEGGMVRLREDGLLKAAKGITTIEEVLRTVV